MVIYDCNTCDENEYWRDPDPNCSQYCFNRIRHTDELIIWEDTGILDYGRPSDYGWDERVDIDPEIIPGYASQCRISILSNIAIRNRMQVNSLIDEIKPFLSKAVDFIKLSCEYSKTLKQFNSVRNYFYLDTPLKLISELKELGKKEENFRKELNSDAKIFNENSPHIKIRGLAWDTDFFYGECDDPLNAVIDVVIDIDEDFVNTTDKGRVERMRKELEDAPEKVIKDITKILDKMENETNV